MTSVEIAPSIAAGNLLRLEEEAVKLERAGADAIHFDVMDGHFVPLLTIGVPFLEQLRQKTKLHLDVHIMVSNPDEVFEHYLNAGADTLTIPCESARHAHRIVQGIQGHGKQAGLALNPGTPWEFVKPLLPNLDQITVMGVNPGYSRQKHIPETALKVKEISDYCKEQGLSPRIQVDGGVSDKNISQLFNSGARNFVAGGFVFGDQDAAEAIALLRQTALRKGTA